MGVILELDMRRAMLALIGVAFVGAGLLIGGAQRAGQDPGPVLTRDMNNKRDWTLRYEMVMHGYREGPRTVRRVQTTSRIVFSSATVVFPVIGSTAAHDAHTGRFRGSVYINRKRIDAEGRYVEGYQGGTKIVVWDVADVNAAQFGLSTRIYTTSYQTRIDEARAMRIDWSEKELAPVIAGCLQPQLFVEPGDPSVAALVEEWTNGKPRKAKPYYLAKYLAAKVLEHVTVQGSVYGQESREWTREVHRGQAGVHGVWLAEPGVTAESGKGSPMDLVNLLCSVYRAAGLPARVVIAEDHKETIKRDMPMIHAWVEFYLFDDRWDRGEWIPVDIIHQREFSSRAPKLEQRWQHFGHSEEFDFMVPFAHHWVPPTAVRSPGPAAMWGWVVAPAEPMVVPYFDVESMETVKRGDDPDFEDPPLPIGTGGESE